MTGIMDNADFYTKKTEFGEVMCKDYSLYGKTYRQETLEMDQLAELSTIIGKLGIPGVSDVQDIGNSGVSAGPIIEAIFAKKLYAEALAIVLYREDGTRAQPEDFRRGLVADIVTFAGQVIADFFRFNATAIDAFVTFFSTVLPGGMEAIAQSVPSSTGSRPATSRSART